MNKKCFWLSVVIFCMAITAIAQPLTGIKTIGGTNPDYPTIHAAICSLNVHGTDIPGITFLIRGGTYNEAPDSIINVQGAGTNARVVFRPADTLGILVNETSTVNNMTAFTFANVDYITFDGSHASTPSRRLITLTSSDSSIYTYFSLMNGSDYCCIKNVTITRTATSVAVSGNYVYPVVPDTGCMNDSVLNCRLNGGSYGISIFSNSNQFVVQHSGWVIADNEIVDCRVGIRLYCCNSITIRHNIIHQQTASLECYYGIECNNYSNVLIESNWISGLTCENNNGSIYGIYAYYNDYYARIHGLITITNNMIDLAPLSPTYMLYGIYKVDHGNILDNTVHISGSFSGSRPLESSSFALVAFENSVTSTDTIANNILVNERTGGNDSSCYHVCLLRGNNLNLSNNNILSTVDNATDDNRYAVELPGGIVYNTLSDLLASPGNIFKVHSIGLSPTFVGAPNLHIDPVIPSPAEGTAISIGSVPRDFDGDLRDSLHPDIGADEGNFTPLSVNHKEFAVPKEFSLSPIYPNPFNSTATIRFSLPIASTVKGEVFDIIGRKVSTLLNDRFNAGEHRIQFDGSKLASGIYFVRMTAGSFTAQQKMVLLK